MESKFKFMQESTSASSGEDDLESILGSQRKSINNYLSTVLWEIEDEPKSSQSNKKDVNGYQRLYCEVKAREEHQENGKFQSNGPLSDDEGDFDEKTSLLSKETNDTMVATMAHDVSEIGCSIEDSQGKLKGQGRTSVTWHKRLFQTMDHSFLRVMALCYFCQGFRTFIDISVLDLFKNYLKLQPAKMQMLTAVISFPTTIKMVYGFFSDNVPLFGSRRKSYLAANGLMQYLFLLPLMPVWINNEYLITLFLTLFTLHISFNDSLVDALMVMQSRKDPINGSNDLNSYSWLWLSVGGVAGSISAGFFTQYLNPHVSFIICGGLGLIMSLFGLRMRSSVEQNSRGLAQRYSSKLLCNNLKTIKEALKSPEIYRTILYFMLSGMLVPQFYDVNYFFQLNVLHFTKMQYSLLTLNSYVGLMIGILLFHKYFKNCEVRSLLVASQICNLIGALLLLIVVNRINITWLGISDGVYITFTSLISDTLSQLFGMLPAIILFTKITPHNVEATVFATLSGALNFGSSVGGPVMGSFLCRLFGVDTQHLDRYDLLLKVQILAIVLSLFLVYLIPSNKEIDNRQKENNEKFENEENLMIIE